MVDMAERFRASVVGGKWDETQKALNRSLGSGKRSFVFRACAAAQNLTPAIIAKLEALPEVPPSWILDNRWFIPTGIDGKAKRLFEKGCLAALDHASEDLLAKKAINADSFGTIYCGARKYAETWIDKKQKIYGANLCKLPLWTRLADYLMSSKARDPEPMEMALI